MKAALVQLTSSDDPAQNAVLAADMVTDAADAGARFVLTPEVTNCVSMSRRHQRSVLHTEDNDPTLVALRALAERRSIWLLIGSLALKSRSDERFVNRSFLIAPDGEVRARYDKIHMFDVDVSETETYRESEGYRPGDRAVTALVDGHQVGLTICYDLRFPALFRALAQAGASVITVPSAFSPVTGEAHWEALLRARAIETGAYVLAPAQTGTHPSAAGRPRTTWGHSLVVSPWGEVLADGGTEPGVTLVELDPQAVEDARRRIPSLRHDREFQGP